MDLEMFNLRYQFLFKHKIQIRKLNGISRIDFYQTAVKQCHTTAKIFSMIAVKLNKMCQLITTSTLKPNILQVKLLTLVYTFSISDRAHSRWIKMSYNLKI